MHPPLHKPHPHCQAVVDALTACHVDHEYAKFWGKCNKQKAELDACFRAEKELRRKANMEKGLETKKLMERIRNLHTSKEP
jgi:COX assembly protein 2